MRIFLLLFMAASSVVVAQTNAPDPLELRVEPRTWPGMKVSVGGWKAWVEHTAADDPRMQAPRSHVVAYRQGPDEAQPTVLFRETTNRGVGLWLREDGTTIIQCRNTDPPLIAFPGRGPVEIVLPGPRKQSRSYPPHTSIDNLWLLDDVVVYSRNAYPGHTLIGFFRIDATRREIVDNQLSLEVAEAQQAPASAADIEYRGPLIRTGDFVFWANAGGNTAAAGPWRERKIYALNLKANTITDANDVPREVLREHKAKWLDYLEKTDHYSRKEMEAWILSMIGEVGTKDDLGRLTAMEAKVHSSKALYTKAIAAISAR